MEKAAWGIGIRTRPKHRLRTFTKCRLAAPENSILSAKLHYNRPSNSILLRAYPQSFRSADMRGRQPRCIFKICFSPPNVLRCPPPQLCRLPRNAAAASPVFPFVCRPSLSTIQTIRTHLQSLLSRRKQFYRAFSYRLCDKSWLGKIKLLFAGATFYKGRQNYCSQFFNKKINYK